MIFVNELSCYIQSRSPPRLIEKESLQLAEGSLLLCFYFMFSFSVEEEIALNTIFSKVCLNLMSSAEVLFAGPFVRPPLLLNLAFISRSSSMKVIFSGLYSMPAGLIAEAFFERTRAASPQSWVTIMSPGVVIFIILRSAS